VAANRFVTPAAYLAALTQARHVTLGEIHDNPDHHRLQAWVVRRIGGGKRAIVFEHFRTDQQAMLDAFGTGRGDAASGVEADEAADKLFLVSAWAQSGWPDQTLYRPLMIAVIENGGSILAGNPPRQRVMEVARNGHDALSGDAQRRLLLDRDLGGDLDDGLLGELEASHCGLMPKGAFTNMALAQRLKDASMARVMTDAAIRGEGTVLIAGNGHVRLDRGVPWYLERMRGGDEAGVVAVGHVEVDPARLRAEQYMDGQPYSYVVFTPAAARPDPCEEEMRKRFMGQGKP
jgi:uncharacterized iron-regulated protein